VAPSNLRGNYFVVPTATAIKQAWKLCDGSVREYQILKRHGLKLMWWPAGMEGGEAGADIDWDWIKTLESKRIGELRVDEHVNGCNNVRIIFFKANIIIPGDPLVKDVAFDNFPERSPKIYQQRVTGIRGNEGSDRTSPLRRIPSGVAGCHATPGSSLTGART